MKKAFSSMLSFWFLFSLSFGNIASANGVIQTEVAPEPYALPFEPTESEIEALRSAYNAVNTNIPNEVFATQPTLSGGIYELGELNSAAINKAVEQINFYRKLAFGGFNPDAEDSFYQEGFDLAYNSEFFEIAQRGAIGMAASNKVVRNLALDATKPIDMPDIFWQQANEGTFTSSISASAEKQTLNDVQDDMMASQSVGTYSDYNRARYDDQTVVWRSKLLSLNASGLGFGYAPSNDLGKDPDHFAVTHLGPDDFTVLPGSNPFDIKTVAHWPSNGLFPYELYQKHSGSHQNMQWSVHLNAIGYTGFTSASRPLTVTITNTETDEVTSIPLPASEVTPLNGQYKAISFRPSDDFKPELDVWYRVDIKGNPNQPSGQFEYTYHTRFVQMAVEEKTYNVTYNVGEEGTNAPTNQTKQHGIDLTLTSDVPSRSGYDFLGWDTDPAAETVVYKPGDIYKEDADLTLYAVWKLKTYTVTYDANGGTGAPADQIKEHDVDLALSSVIPTKEGYTFLGWDTDTAAKTVVFNAGGIYTANANVTLYAVWELNKVPPVQKYTVQYNANGGIGAPDLQIKTHGEDLTLRNTLPTRKGYTFVGWGTSPDATTVAYQPGGIYTIDADITLYAIWKLDSIDPVDPKDPVNPVKPGPNTNNNKKPQTSDQSWLWLALTTMIVSFTILARRKQSMEI